MGCSSLPLADGTAMARKYGISLVEPRCAADEPVHVGLSKAERAAARAELDWAGSSAHDLGAPSIRVSPGRSELGSGAKSVKLDP